MMPIDASVKVLEYLQNRNFKKALKITEKYLKRDPSSSQYNILKSLCRILLSPYRFDEPLRALYEILNNTKLNQTTLTAVVICFNIIERIDILKEILKKSNDSKNPNEELLTHLFMIYAAEESFKNQVKIARILFTHFKTCKSYCWISICSYLDKKYGFSDDSTPLKDTIEIKVAIKMLAKRISEAALIETEVVVLYCYLLKEVGLFSELLVVLNGPHKDKVTSVESEYFTMKLECLVNLGLKEEVVDDCISRLKNQKNCTTSQKKLLEIYEAALKNPEICSNMLKKIDSFRIFLQEAIETVEKYSNFKYFYIQLIFCEYKNNLQINDKSNLKKEIIERICSYYTAHGDTFIIYQNLKPFFETFNLDLINSLNELPLKETKNVSLNTILSLWKNSNGIFDSLPISERLQLICEKFKFAMNSRSVTDKKYQCFIMVDVMLSIIQNNDPLYNSWDILFLITNLIRTLFQTNQLHSWILLLCHLIFVNNGYMASQLIQVKENIGLRNFLLETIFISIPFHVITGNYTMATYESQHFSYFHDESSTKLNEYFQKLLRNGIWKTAEEVIETKFKFLQSYNLKYVNLSMNYNEFCIKSPNVVALKNNPKVFPQARTPVCKITKIVSTNDIPQFFIHENSYKFKTDTVAVDNIDQKIFNSFQSKNRLFSTEIFSKYSDHKIFIIQLLNFLITRTMTLVHLPPTIQDFSNYVITFAQEAQTFLKQLQSLKDVEKNEDLYILSSIPIQIGIWKKSHFIDHIIEFYLKLKQMIEIDSSPGSVFSNCDQFKNSTAEYVQYINTCLIDQNDLIKNCYSIIQFGVSVFENFSYLQTHIVFIDDILKSDKNNKHGRTFLLEYSTNMCARAKDIVTAVDLCYSMLAQSAPQFNPSHPLIQIKSLIDEDLLNSTWEKLRAEHLDLLKQLKDNFEAKLNIIQYSIK